jgi:hypothetical protein
MSFTLLMSGVIVGRSELEHRDALRRVAHGAFRPGLGYELAEPIFALYEDVGDDPEALARYRKARQALSLQLTSSNGSAVALRDLHIRRDRTATHARAALVLEIETDDPAVWGDSPQFRINR